MIFSNLACQSYTSARRSATRRARYAEWIESLGFQQAACCALFSLLCYVAVVLRPSGFDIIYCVVDWLDLNVSLKRFPRPPVDVDPRLRSTKCTPQSAVDTSLILDKYCFSELTTIGSYLRSIRPHSSASHFLCNSCTIDSNREESGEITAIWDRAYGYIKEIIARPHRMPVLCAALERKKKLLTKF